MPINRPPLDVIQPNRVPPRPPPQAGQRDRRKVQLPLPLPQHSDEDSDSECAYMDPHDEETFENSASELLYDEAESNASETQPGMYAYAEVDTSYDYSTAEYTSNNSASSSELNFASHSLHPLSVQGRSTHFHAGTTTQATTANNLFPKQLIKQTQQPVAQPRRQAVRFMEAGIRQAAPDDGDESNYSNPDSAHEDDEHTDNFPDERGLRVLEPEASSAASKVQNMSKLAGKPLPNRPNEETAPKVPPHKPGKQLVISNPTQHKDSKSQSKVAAVDNARNFRTLDVSRAQSTTSRPPAPVPAPAAKPATLPRQQRNVAGPTTGTQDTSFSGDQQIYCDMTDCHGSSSVPATSLCKTCKKAFCAVCTTKHASKKVFGTHSVVTLQVRPCVMMNALPVERTQCDKHSDKVVEFYCDTCPAILCNTCIISHIHHSEIPLGEAAVPCTRRQQQLKQQVDTQLADCIEMQEKLQIKQQKINDHYKMTLEAVNFKASQVVQLVRQWQAQARAMLEEEHTNVSVALAHASAGVDERMKELTDVQRHLTARGDNAATNVQLCEQVVQAAARLQALGNGACDPPELTVQQYLPNDASDMDLVDCVLGKFIPQRKL
jgi:hypothetical protein